eukprot:gene22210-30450_t
MVLFEYGSQSDIVTAFFETLPSPQKLDHLLPAGSGLLCQYSLADFYLQGNPQNMLLSQDAISVMPSYKFFIYMLLPSTTVWLISKLPLVTYIPLLQAGTTLYC